MNNSLIGIISDSHDNRNNIRKAVEIFNQKEVCLVIHAGDFIAPFTCLDFKELNCKMEMVFGNNDGEKIGLSNAFKNLGTLLPGPRSFQVNDKKILLMHEHECVEEFIGAESADIIIYGHTHEADIRKGHPLVINPGEAGGWLKGKSTIAVLDTESMETELIDL
jgi:putative phosphoesterase